MDQCYACMVGVWTGPESHSEGCSMAHRTVNVSVHHEIHTEDYDDRTGWDCSCGHSGNVGEWVDVDIASDKHIDYDRGDTRVNSSASPDAPWPVTS
jgi:hypothetical protein